MSDTVKNSEDFSHLRSMSTVTRKIDIDGGCDAMLYFMSYSVYSVSNMELEHVVICTNIS